MTTTKPAPEAQQQRPPALSMRELARWAWRQLTSMRVALILLFLLAVAAIPGSVLPQSDVNPLEVADFRARNPELAQWYERLGLFDVFSSPWFAAIYLALLVSLVGCILPRTWDHVKTLRAQPPRTPQRLSRMPGHRELTVDAAPGEVLAAARDELRARRYRLRSDADADAAQDSVSGENGYIRETGNIVFHLSVVAVLLAVALGGLFGYRATVLVPEGSGFANSVIQFDNLSSGALFDPADLPPFSLDVEKFEMSFIEEGTQQGVAEDFEATVRFVPEPGAEPETRTIRVNDPLEIDGTLVHILNPGYAPAITVRAADGETILAEGPVPFLPQEQTGFTSTGVVKVEMPPELGEDIGIEGLFLPTAVVDENGPRSVFPEAKNPALFFTAYHGDLGLDDGTPQSVYRLDTDDLTQFADESGQPFSAALSVGETVALPNDAGFVTFDGYVTWVNLQVSRNAGKEIALVGAVLAVVGLMGSLYVRRRRMWVRASAGPDGRTVVEVAGLHRNEGGDVVADVDAVVEGLLRRVGAQGSDEEN